MVKLRQLFILSWGYFNTLRSRVYDKFLIQAYRAFSINICLFAITSISGRIHELKKNGGPPAGGPVRKRTICSSSYGGFFFFFFFFFLFLFFFFFFFFFKTLFIHFFFLKKIKKNLIQ